MLTNTFNLLPLNAQRRRWIRNNNYWIPLTLMSWHAPPRDSPQEPEIRFRIYNRRPRSQTRLPCVVSPSHPSRQFVSLRCARRLPAQPAATVLLVFRAPSRPPTPPAATVLLAFRAPRFPLTIRHDSSGWRFLCRGALPSPNKTRFYPYVFATSLSVACH